MTITVLRKLARSSPQLEAGLALQSSESRDSDSDGPGPDSSRCPSSSSGLTSSFPSHGHVETTVAVTYHDGGACVAALPAGLGACHSGCFCRRPVKSRSAVRQLAVCARDAAAARALTRDSEFALTRCGRVGAGVSLRGAGEAGGSPATGLGLECHD